MPDYLKERYTHMERKFIGDDLSSEKHPFVEEILGYLDDCNKHLRLQEPHVTIVKQSFEQLQDCYSKEIKGNKTVDVLLGSDWRNGLEEVEDEWE